MKGILAAAVVALALSLTVSPSPALAQTCIGAAVTVPLAQGATVVGSVTVGNDASFLYVTFQATGGRSLSQLDLAVATSLAGIPQSSGAPKVASFPYRTQLNPAVASYTFAVPLGSFTIGTQLYVAAHATATSSQGSQSAWGAGKAFPGSAACGGCDGHGGGDGEHCGGDDHHGCDGHDGGQQSGHQGDQHGHDSFAAGGGSGASGNHGDKSSQAGGDHHDGEHHDGDHQDGHDDHGDGDHTSGNGGSCGATYFTYVLNCSSPE